MGEAGCLRDAHFNNLETSGNSVFNGFISTNTNKGFDIGPAAISGLTAVSLTSNKTLEVQKHSLQVGKYCSVTGDTTITLPGVVIGATFIIVNASSDAGGLLKISPNNNTEMFLVNMAGDPGTVGKDILNTKVSQKKYDYVKLVGLTNEGWLIDDKRGTWVDQA